jgi:hypothetical protein
MADVVKWSVHTPLGVSQGSSNDIIELAKDHTLDFSPGDGRDHYDGEVTVTYDVKRLDGSTVQVVIPSGGLGKTSFGRHVNVTARRTHLTIDDYLVGTVTIRDV